MLCLLFEVAGCTYAVEVSRVEQVVPRIRLRTLPQAPTYLAGLFDLEGEVVPVIDLGILFDSQPCANRLSTRIILVRVPGMALQSRRLGLIAEHVTEIRSSGLEPITDEELEAQATRQVLGRVLLMGDRLVQMVRVQYLLPDDVRDHLFGTILGGAQE